MEDKNKDKKETEKSLIDIVYSLKDFKEYIEGGSNDKRDQFNLDRIHYVLYGIWNLYGHNYINDNGHGKKHVFDVIERSFKILEWYLRENKCHELDTDQKRKFFFSRGINIHNIFIMVGVAGIFHDLFQEEDRENHHLRVKEVTNSIKRQRTQHSGFSEDIYFFLSMFMLTKIELICSQHRASFDGEFSNILCAIFNTADKDPLDLGIIVKRCWKYTSNKLRTENEDSIIDDVLIHLEDKFSSSGYLFRNKSEDGIFYRYYKDDIIKFQKEVDSLLLDRNRVKDYL